MLMINSSATFIQRRSQLVNLKFFGENFFEIVKEKQEVMAVRQRSGGEWLGNITVAKNLFGYLNFKELSRMRLVCQSFNEAILTHSIYKDAQIKIQKQWKEEVEGIPLGYVRRWKNVKFDKFLICEYSPPFIANIWPSASENISSITLRKIGLISCERVVEFLHGCPNLEEISLIDLKFQRDAELEGLRHVTFFCRHVGMRLPPNVAFRPQNLKKISLQGIPVVPTCLLDYFIECCPQPRLESLEFTNSVWREAARNNQMPTLETVMEKLKLLIHRNIGTLKHLSLTNASGGHNLLQKLMMTDTRPEYAVRISRRLRLKSLKLDQSSSSSVADEEVGLQTFLNFLYDQLATNPELRELEVSLFKTAETLRLATMLEEQMRSITKLTIGLYKSLTVQDPDEALDLTRFENILALKHIEMKDYMFKTGNGISFNWLNSIPLNLKTLNIGHANIPNIEQYAFLNGGIKLEGLTGLDIKYGDLVGDVAMQAIITGFPLLQNLVLNDSELLTDAGLTGWPLQAVENILRANCYYVLRENIKYTLDAGKKSLKDLKHLRVLDLKGCENISDISISTFKFPLMREINLSRCHSVTDIGLIWLGEKIPSLETIIINNNRRITKFGLNEFITGNPAIFAITTTTVTANRTFPGIETGLSPNFKKVVTVSD